MIPAWDGDLPKYEGELDVFNDKSKQTQKSVAGQYMHRLPKTSPASLTTPGKCDTLTIANATK